MADIQEPGSDFLLRIRWYVYIRWFLLLAITVPSVLSLYVGSDLQVERLSGVVFSAILITSNAVFYALSKLRRGRMYYRVLGLVFLALDVLFISYFIYSKGGIESRSQILYALPILMAAALFGRAGVYLAAALSAFIYDLVILANYVGLLHSPEAVTHQATDGPYVINTMVFFSAVILLIGVLSDFLTRLLIQKEQAARRSAEALERAQTMARIGSWEWDVSTDTMKWSDGLYDIFGLPRGSELKLESFLKRIHPDDRAWLAGLIGRSLKTHKPFSFENRIVRSDKRESIIHGEGKIVTDRHGRVVQLHGITQDITAERALERAKGDFVSLASHQLRTPASGVRMLLALLRDGYVDTLTPKQLSTVEQAYEANERLLRIADDLLNVAKLESGRLVLNKQQIELRLWLENVVAPHKILAKGERQKLHVTIPKKPAYLYGDPERLAMVIDNLLSNARKYTPARGSIDVVLTPGIKRHKIIVSDTGSGMTRAEIGTLFEKFGRLQSQVNRNTEGTGLGLYLAKSIVDLHGGTIQVRSKPGKGSTFTISLPQVTV